MLAAKYNPHLLSWTSYRHLNIIYICLQSPCFRYVHKVTLMCKYLLRGNVKLTVANIVKLVN